MVKLIIIVLIANIGFAQTADDVWKKIDEVDSFRNSLAKTLKSDQAITEETFNTVCKPVGGKIKMIAESTGWTFKQVTHKNRNEKNAIDENVKKYYDSFLNDAKKMRESYKTEINGVTGTRYLQKITVQENCLSCHGQLDKRPQFIKDKYANDKAYDFKVGDLRGVYSVFVPEKK